MQRLLLNLRDALRSLARTPAFTITVVLALALGIGANSAVSSAIDSILLRPLPYVVPAASAARIDPMQASREE